MAPDFGAGFQVLSYYSLTHLICQALFSFFSNISTHSIYMVITPQNIYLRYNAILSFAIRYPVSIAIATAADAPLNADFFAPSLFPNRFSIRLLSSLRRSSSVQMLRSVTPQPPTPQAFEVSQMPLWSVPLKTTDAAYFLPVPVLDAPQLPSSYPYIRSHIEDTTPSFGFSLMSGAISSICPW